MNVEQLREKLFEYQRAYYTTGRSLVSDTEYDRLFDQLVEIEKKHPELKTSDSPTVRVGSDLSSDFPEVEHTIPVLSLDKAYSASEIYSFIEKSQKSQGKLSFVLEEKIDGFSIVLYYRNGILDKAVTRGNGSVGNDVTANVKTIHSVPIKLTQPVNIAVRGEIYLPKKDFEHINATLEQPYANPRNLAAGTIRRNKSSETAKVPLSVFCYEGFWEENTEMTDHIQILGKLRQLGFRTDPDFSLFCSTRQEAQSMLRQYGLEGHALSFDDIPADIERRTSERKNLDYEIDGLVVKVNELSVRQNMGYTEHHPRWAIAYKFEAPVAQSTVIDIDVQVGRTGRLTPMARIKPVELSGSVISNVTLHNQDYVDMLEIAKGDIVEISKRGDVIPAVESVTEKNACGNTTFRMPDTCPVCGSPVVKSGAHHFCLNESCPEREKGRLKFFCAKKQMDIEGLGDATLDLLYNLGYLKTIPDIYRFDYSALLRDKVEGFGRKKISSITKAVEESKNRSWTSVAVSLGVPEMGHKAVGLIEQFTDIESIGMLIEKAGERDAFTSMLSAIDGIGEITAKSIADGVCSDYFIQTVRQLEELGLKFTHEEHEKKESVIDRIFEGQTWCVTGTFENFSPRDKAMQEVIKRGGKEVSSVSSKTTCLLAGSNAGSKLSKAMNLGVRIISEKEFMELIK